MGMFTNIGPFRADLRISERGEEVHRLLKAMQTKKDGRMPGTYPIACALGDPFSPERRKQALSALESLPAAQQQKILSAYHRSRNGEA